MQNQTFKLSLKPNDYPPNLPFVYADQYDVGRTFVATVYDTDGSLYAFNGETVTVVGTKPSGTGFSYTATASGNTVTFETTGQMTVVAGNVTCGIIIEKDGDRIGTLHFILHVQPAALSADTIIDSNDFGSIISDAVAEYMEEHGIVIDSTLTVAGAAADAAKVGEEIADLKSAIDDAGLTDEAKEALLACFRHIGTWDDDDAQTYYDALEDALYNTTWAITNALSNCTTSNSVQSVRKGGSYSATLTASSGYTLEGATISITMGGTDITATAYSNGVISIQAVTGALVITATAVQLAPSSISAVYTQSGYVFPDTVLTTLKPDIVLTATYPDSSTAVIADGYELSGTLAVGTSTVTITYTEKTTTISVTVTAIPTVAWEQGTIVRGAESTSNTRLRTDTYIPDTVKTLSVPSGYKLLASVFDSTDTWVGHVWADGTITTDSAGLEQWVLTYDFTSLRNNYPGYKYRILMRNETSTQNISTSAASNVTLTY